MDGKRKKSDVTRIFWPSHCTDKGGGLLVGWNVHSFTGCVATVTDKNVDLSLLEKALQVVGHSDRYSHLFDDNGGPPTVLGELRTRRPLPWSEPPEIKELRQTANFWLTLEDSEGHPRLCDIHCCGFRYSVFSVTVQFILYDQPRGMRYFSTIPFGTSIEPAPEPTAFARRPEFERALMQINDSSLVESVLHEAIARLRVGAAPAAMPRSVSESALGASIATQPGWGTSGPPTGALRDTPAEAPAARAARTAGAAGGLLRRLAGRALWLVLWLLRAALVDALLLFLLAARLAAPPLCTLLELPLAHRCEPGAPPGAPPRAVRVRHVSATARQLYHRLSALFAAPLVAPASVATLSGKPSNARAAALATHVRSLASLCVLDLLLGAACCVLILVHLPAVAAAVDVAAARQSLLFLRAIRWIMGVPAGLKLNDALDYCLGNLCILGVKCFQVVYMLAQPHLPAVLRALALSGLGGLTVMLSLAADLLSVATLHIAVFYALAARWHGVQTRVLGSLWRLFRGRKRNVLRGRIDACDYSLDQLLLGTALFTTLVFLFPTTFVYYLLFCIPYWLVGAVQLALRMSVACFNYFPLSACALRLLAPACVPGGVHLELITPAAAADSDTSSHSAAGAAGGGGSGLTLDTGPGVVGQRHLALRHSSSLNEIGGAAEGGLAEGAWASSKPSPLRANERRRATLVGRSAYFSLRSRPLPFRSLFAAHRTSIAAAVNQYAPGKVLRSLLLAEDLRLTTLPERPPCEIPPVAEWWEFAQAAARGAPREGRDVSN